MTAALGGVALPQLERLLRLVERDDLRAPLTQAALVRCGLGAAWEELRWMAALDRAGMVAVLQVAIAERTTRPVPRVELVWTGPEARSSAARDTAVLLRQLFARAERDVIVAGFRVDGGKTLFEPLQAAMRDRGVTARLFLNLLPIAGVPAEEAARQGAEGFLRDCWPGPPYPLIYCDPRTLVPGAKINLHAKCVVVDARWTLIGSANFTHNAMSRSIEAGVLVEDTGLASELAAQWQGLVDTGLVRLVG